MCAKAPLNWFKIPPPPPLPEGMRPYRAFGSRDGLLERKRVDEARAADLARATPEPVATSGGGLSLVDLIVLGSLVRSEPAAASEPAHVVEPSPDPAPDHGGFETGGTIDDGGGFSTGGEF